jgi:hypothetical protein
VYATEEKRKANAQKYKEKGRANSNALKKRNLEYIREYREEHPCVDCGESRWWVLDFDHRVGEIKKYNVSRMRYHKLATIQIEIAKCDIRCKNCHADRHYREG